MYPLRQNQDPAPRLHYCFLSAPLSLHPLPSLMSNFLNLPFGTQGRSWRLDRKTPMPRSPTVSCLVSKGEQIPHHLVLLLQTPLVPPWAKSQAAINKGAQLVLFIEVSLLGLKTWWGRMEVDLKGQTQNAQYIVSVFFYLMLLNRFYQHILFENTHYEGLYYYYLISICICDNFRCYLDSAKGRTDI